MKLEYVPLLATQSDLYRLPRGLARFEQYLETMIDPTTRDLRLPLVAMNPMGKDHLPRFLDALSAIDADGVGASATAEAADSLSAEPGAYRVCLVASDDLLGGWTNRFAAELSHRRGEAALARRGWITGILWTSEAYGPAEVREETLTSIFRTAYVARRGAARTLRELLAQEGSAMRRSGARMPALEPDDLGYTREVLTPLLEREDMPALVAALFGDAAARELGYEPLGLSPRAGLALALHGGLE